MPSVRPHYVPAPYQDAADAGRVILRDGTTAWLRPARCEDQPALEAFFRGLSAEARRQRFFSLSPPTAEWIRSLCEPSDPRQARTLLVLRAPAGVPKVIATASYLGVNDTTAEVAFAVDDAFRGKGLGTLLLERLAVLAVRQGFVRFWAVTQADNRAMIEVFRESGFGVGEQQQGAYVEVVEQSQPRRLQPFRDRLQQAAGEPVAEAVVGVAPGA